MHCHTLRKLEALRWKMVPHAEKRCLHYLLIFQITFSITKSITEQTLFVLCTQWFMLNMYLKSNNSCQKRRCYFIQQNVRLFYKTSGKISKCNFNGFSLKICLIDRFFLQFSSKTYQYQFTPTPEL